MTLDISSGASVPMDEIHVIGGANGSGKTTFAQGYLATHGVRYLSADDLALQISPSDPPGARLQAGKEFFLQLRQAISRHESLLIESTLSGRSLLKILDQARAEGYRLTVVFLFLGSPEGCIGRVRGRVLQGGHDVPEVDIRRRFGRSRRNFWDLYRPLADSWHLYFNGGQDFQPVALGERESDQVLDEDLFQLFRRGVLEERDA